MVFKFLENEACVKGVEILLDPSAWRYPKGCFVVNLGKITPLQK